MSNCGAATRKSAVLANTYRTKPAAKKIAEDRAIRGAVALSGLKMARRLGRDKRGSSQSDKATRHKRNEASHNPSTSCVANRSLTFSVSSTDEGCEGTVKT